MEISSDSCCIYFEEGSAYAGKAVMLNGERISKGFLLNLKPMSWVVMESDGFEHLYPVNDDEKDALITHIIEDGLKQNYSFKLWS